MASARYASVVIVSAICVLIGATVRDSNGAIGAGIGVGVGLVLCGISHGLMVAGRLSPRRAGLFAVLGVFSSIFSIAIAVVVIGVIAPQYTAPAALTALSVYLVYRGFDAYEESRKATTPVSPVAPSILSASGTSGAATSASAVTLAGGDAPGPSGARRESDRCETERHDSEEPSR